MCPRTGCGEENGSYLGGSNMGNTNTDMKTNKSAVVSPHLAAIYQAMEGVCMLCQKSGAERVPIHETVKAILKTPFGSMRLFRCKTCGFGWYE